MPFPRKIKTRLRFHIRHVFLLMLIPAFFTLFSINIQVEAKEDVESTSEDNSNYEKLKTFSEVLSLIESTYVEKVSSKKIQAKYKLDSTGFPIGYCEKCGVSDFYKIEELDGDSRCCNSKILPNKPL